MTRILPAIFDISSMRKTGGEFHSGIVIGNIGYLCEADLKELPYRETVNNCLKGVNPEELQRTVCALVKRLIRSRAFEDARIRGDIGISSLTGAESSAVGRNWTEITSLKYIIAERRRNIRNTAITRWKRNWFLETRFP